MGFFARTLVALLGGLLVAGLPVAATAVSVEGLYEGVVAGDASEAGRAAAAPEALRQVVVRITGRRAAATDPALASLYADAGRRARTFRAGAAGQVVVGFDPDSLEADLARAGQRLWSRERPVTLVVLVSARPGAPRTVSGAADPELRREVATTAQQRGLPIAWPTGLPPALEIDRYTDAAAGRLEPLRELARQYGADGVLLGRSGAGAPAWNWLGPAGSGAAAGSGADAVHALADRYGAQFAAAGASRGQVLVVVRGVRDLAGYAAAGAALGALPNVRGQLLEEASGDMLRFRLAFDGDPDALRQAVRDSAHLTLDDTTPSGGALQLVLRP